MSSNPLGKGTKNVTANVPISLFLELTRLATISGVKVGEYARTVLEDAAGQGIILRKKHEDYMRWVDAVKGGKTPLPKVRLEIVTPGEIETLKAAEKPSTKYGKKAS